MELAVKGHNAVMPTIVRKASKPYKWVIGHVPLSEVANKEKKIPRDYITADGFGITAACRRYLAPLVQGEAYPPYKDGLRTTCGSRVHRYDASSRPISRSERRAPV